MGRTRMKLATFTTSPDGPLLGVVDDAGGVVALQAAHERLRGGRSARLESMLALIGGGAETVALAAELAREAPADCHHELGTVRLASRSETLHPGEILGSGTVGTGCGLEQGRFLSDGDVVELEVERIGVLRNRFVR
jgi:hypothetical protein